MTYPACSNIMSFCPVVMPENLRVFQVDAFARRHFSGIFRDPQQWDLLMLSFPYYSHSTPIRIPKDMGIVWVPLTIRGPHYWESLESPLTSRVILAKCPGSTLPPRVFHAGKVLQNRKMDGESGSFAFSKGRIFRFHVSFHGCIGISCFGWVPLNELSRSFTTKLHFRRRNCGTCTAPIYSIS